MEINPAEIKKMTAEYANALSSLPVDTWERIIVLEETQLDLIDCLLRSPRNGRTLNYLKSIIFRLLNILSSRNGATSYIPSVRTPTPCNNPTVRLLNAQLDIYILLDRLDIPYAEKAEILSYENRKQAILSSL